MKHLVVIFFVFVSFSSFAQTSSIGVRIGLNKTNVSSSQYSDEPKSRNGFIGGVTYEYLFNKNFFIGAELNYNERGYATSYLFVNETTSSSVQYEGTHSYNYISLPIKSGFYFGNKVQGFGSIGVIPSILVDAKIVFPTNLDQSGQLSGMETRDVKDITNSFDLAAMVELGISYKIQNQYSIFSSATYQRSFTSFSSSDSYYPAPYTEAFHKGLSFSLGVRYTLSK